MCITGDPGSVDQMWGKTLPIPTGTGTYPLRLHLLDTYLAASALWDQWLSPRLRDFLARELAEGDQAAARQTVAFIAAFHDVGKNTSIFQGQMGSTWWKTAPWLVQVRADLSAAGYRLESGNALASLEKGDNRTARRHELLGMAMLMDRQPSSGTLGERVRRLGNEPLATSWVAAIVGGHHGKWHVADANNDAIARRVCATVTESSWRPVQDGLLAHIEAATGMGLADLPTLDRDRAATVCVLVTGLVIFADWIASSDRCVRPGWHRYTAAPSVSGTAWLAERADELDSLVASVTGSFVAPSDPHTAILGTAPDGSTHTPRPLQADANRVGSGAWFVAYPTGEGKTEAALMRHTTLDGEGLIFALPTRATTEDMHRRLTQKLSPGNTVLLSHQFAAAHEIHCASSYDVDWYDSSIRRLLAPVSAATCDQVLAGALTQKWIALRLLALANHHVVLDEIHTYDHYQAALLTDLLSWWGATGTPVTLLSATMPTWQQRAFANAYTGQDESAPVQAGGYPAHWTIDPCGTRTSSRRPDLFARTPPVAIDLVRTADAHAIHVDWAVAQHTEHPCVDLAVIRSTVKAAINTARGLRARLADADVVCLHSRMTLQHRTRIQAALENRLGPDARPGRPVIVVATSVIEAALNYDFDLMSSDIGPAPSLIQKIGRLWRFLDASIPDTGTRRHPSSRTRRFGILPDRRHLHVVTATTGGRITDGDALPYFAAELERVASWLDDHGVIRVPEDVQDFVDATALDLADLTKASPEEFGQASTMRQQAGNVRAKLPGRVTGRNNGRYRNLHTLTTRELEEVGGDIPTTRFIDRDSASFLLCNLGALHAPAVGADVRVDDVAALPRPSNPNDAASMRSMMGTIVPASGTVLHALREAATATLAAAGMAEWAPHNAAFKPILPVGIEQLDAVGLIYDPALGLVDNRVSHRDETKLLSIET